MIGLREVQKLAYEQQMLEQSIERDYVLTWILTELSRHPSLGIEAILKGGTALKKLFYSEWRYSEDLDFTLKTPWNAEAIAVAVQEVCTACLRSAGLEVSIATKEPRHDGDQLRSMTIYIAYIGPLRRTRRPRELKVDFTADEVIVAKPLKRPLNRMYSDEAKPPCKILCYSLEEILAEKMRTILQRTEPRDLYDVWRLLKEHAQEMDLALTKNIFDAKCRFKGIHVKSLDDFLSARKIEKYQTAWQKRLGDQVQGLSPLKTVVREMKQLLKTHFV
jgi:hypothetical protein